MISYSVVTGGLGFIGSHLVDALVDRRVSDRVLIIDDASEGKLSYKNPKAELLLHDITSVVNINSAINYLRSQDAVVDCVYHTAAVSRTPPAVRNPVNCMHVNVMGSANILNFAQHVGAKRVVLSSSNVVYAADTAYKASKLSMEMLGQVYNHMYGLSVISLRYSNVYGPRLKRGDLGVFAQLRDSYAAKGYCEITGDGEQSRDFTHVSDIVEGNILAAMSDYKGIVDLCTGRNWTINQIVKDLLKFKAQHIEDRPGDIKHIRQDPGQSASVLGWKSTIKLEDSITDIFLVDY